MTLDDLEWIEQEFDTWIFAHKTRVFVAAKISQFNGWHVVVQGQSIADQLIVDSFDAAKLIATIRVAQHIESYPDVNHYRKRAAKPTPETIRKRISKVD